MKKSTKAILLTVAGLLVAMWGFGTYIGDKDEQTPENTESTKKPDAGTDKELGLVSKLDGSAFIVKVTETSNHDEISLTYAKNIEEVKAFNEYSKFTQEDYDAYFSDYAVKEKLLVEGVGKVFKYVPECNMVSIVVPFEGSTNEISVYRSKFEEYTAINKDDLANNFEKSFIDQYVYNEQARRDFFLTFTKIK